MEMSRQWMYEEIVEKGGVMLGNWKERGWKQLTVRGDIYSGTEDSLSKYRKMITMATGVRWQQCGNSLQTGAKRGFGAAIVYIRLNASMNKQKEKKRGFKPA